MNPVALARHTLVSVSLLMGLAGARASPPGRIAQREWLKGSWRVVGSVVRDGTKLIEPGILAVADSAIVVFDYGDRTLKEFSMSGQLKWILTGSGSSDFSNVSSLAVDRQGRIWLAEAQRGRITIVGVSGHVDSVIEHLAGIHRAVPLDRGGFLATFPDSPLPRLYDRDGSPIRAVALPSPLDRVSPPAGESWMASGPAGTTIIAYLWSDRFAVLSRDCRTAQMYRGIQKREFPGVTHIARQIAGRVFDAWKVDSSASPAALSLSVDNTRVAILFGGAKGTGERNGILDTYRVATGGYLGSYRLPESARQAIVRGDRVVALAPRDQPSIRIWQWLPEH